MIEDLDIDNVNNIILFGSASRNQANKDSDIDIFVDIIDKEDEYKKHIKQIIEKFYNSRFYQNYWKIKGIDNNFNVITGKIDEWNELKDNIISTGITLYSKFKSMPENKKYNLLIYFENIKPETKRVLLYKNLYGYNANEKHYQGLLDKYKGIKINKGTIIVPLENKKVFIELFKRFNITIKTKNIIEY